MVGNNIKSATKFFGIADDQKKTGKKILQILFYFAQQRHWMTYLKVIGRWSLQAKKFFCSRQTHMEVIHEHSHGWCAGSCSKEWFNCALDLLQENYIYPTYFSTAVLTFNWNRQWQLIALPVAIYSTWPDWS